MKGHMQDGKFHPHTDYKKGVRKLRDQKAKQEGVRKARNRFHPKGYKPPTFGKKKPVGTWEITKTEYGSSKNVEIFNDEVTIYDDNGQEVVKWISDEWKEDPSIIPAIKNAIKLAKQGRIDEIKERIGFIERGTVDRKKRFLTENDVDRLSDLKINVLLKEIEKRWNVEDNFTGQEGDHTVIIYTNKSDPRYTFELHPMGDDELEDEDGKELEDPIYHNSWYFFPAKDGKGIPNSPTVISETGGYTRKDAIHEFKKEFISYDQEFNS